MAETLATVFPVLFLVASPMALLAKFLWTSKIPWWSVLLAVAIVSWASLVLGEYFQLVHESECEVQIVENAIIGCPIFEHWYTYNLELGWLRGLIYLLPWLALYGLTSVIRKHHNHIGGAPPNTSLERTRER